MKKYLRENANDVTTFMIKMEVDMKLFDWQIDGIFVWELVRVFAYSKIREDFATESKTFSDKWNYFFDRIIVNSFLKFPFFNHSKTDVLVFESSRKHLVDGNYIDIYTKYVCDDLANNKKSFQRYQSSHSFDKLDTNRRGVPHLDAIFFLSKLISTFLKVEFSHGDMEKIATIEKSFKDNFDVSIDLNGLLVGAIKKYKSEYPFYNYLLKIKAPKEIYFVNFSNKAALISAAKKKSIKTIEVQHGLIVKEDLIYHYPNVEKGSLKYFPDSFYSWGQTWGNTISLPISDDHIVLWGNRHIESQTKQFNSIHEKNALLFISQPGLTNDIFKIVLDNIDKLSNYQVIIKLHPMEFNHCHLSKYYPEIKANRNIELIKNERSIYQLFSITKICFGVYSTSLIESLYFSVKLVLLDLSGVEMLGFLIANKKAELLSKPFNLDNILPE